MVASALAERKKRECQASFWCRNAGKVGTVAGIVAGAVVGGACTAASFGVGAVGCAAIGGFVGGAVGSIVTNALDAEDESGWQIAGEALLAGAIGAVVGAGSAVVGAAAFGGGVAISSGMGLKSAAQMALSSARSSLSRSASGTGSASKAAVPKKCNSLTPGTAVVMADGSTKLIKDIEAGDVVLATDPETGETAPKEVVATIVGEGSKNLVRITVDEDGRYGDATGEVIATDGHPFWVAEVGEWRDATDLAPGQWLQTGAGTYAQITAVERWTQTAQVHNLTVADIHTYYVVAGETPVLVHNCGEDALQNYADSLRPGATKKGPHVAAEYTSPSGNTYYGHNGHGLSPQPGGALERALKDSGHHGGCAEVMCLIQAEAAEGAAGIVGGSMRAVRVRGLNSQGSAHGTPISPCPNACQPLLNILRIRAE